MVTLTTGKQGQRNEWDVHSRLASLRAYLTKDLRRPQVTGSPQGPYRFYRVHSRCITSACITSVFPPQGARPDLSTTHHHGDPTIQKLRYADPRNRTKIEKFSQKGMCFFALAETLMVADPHRACVGVAATAGGRTDDDGRKLGAHGHRSD